MIDLSSSHRAPVYLISIIDRIMLPTAFYLRSNPQVFKQLPLCVPPILGKRLIGNVNIKT